MLKRASGNHRGPEAIELALGDLSQRSQLDPRLPQFFLASARRQLGAWAT